MPIESATPKKNLNWAGIDKWSRKAAAQAAERIVFPAMVVTRHRQTSGVCQQVEVLNTDLANLALTEPAGLIIPILAFLTGEICSFLTRPIAPFFGP